MTRALLVGEHNPYSGRAEDALYPWPPESAAGRLCRGLGMSEEEYLAAFERRNLLRTVRWSAPAAREAARTLSAEFPALPRVLLGARVARAFGLAFEPFTFTLVGPLDPDGQLSLGAAAPTATGSLTLVLPHPSGRSRAWDEPGAWARARERVASILRAVAGGRPA